MAARRPLHPSSSFSFVKEGLLLPAHNPSIFGGPILALTVAEKVLYVFLAMLPLHKVQDVILAGAVNVLTAVTVDPVIHAITTSAAVTSYGVDNDGDMLAFAQVLRRLLDGGLMVGPVATAVHGQIMAVACHLGVAALLFSGGLLAAYTRTPLLRDVLVLFGHMSRLARICFGFIQCVAVVVSAFEPGCHRAAALRQASVTIAKNARQAGIVVVACCVIAAAASPWRTTGSREPLNLANLLVYGVERVLYVCVVTAYYNECRHRLQARAETGKERLQGRFSMRHMLPTLLARLQCLCTRMLAFISTHPWVGCIAMAFARRLIVKAPPSMLDTNYDLARANATV